MATGMEMKLGQPFLSTFVKSRSFPHNEGGGGNIITLKSGPTFPQGGRFWPQERLWAESRWQFDPRVTLLKLLVAVCKLVPQRVD